MGNCCGCLKPNNDSSERVYIEVPGTDTSANRIKPVERIVNTNYYQLVLDQADSDFICAKDVSKSDVIKIGSDKASSLRSKFAEVVVHNALSPEQITVQFIDGNLVSTTRAQNFVSKSENQMEQVADSIGNIVKNSNVINDGSAPVVVCFKVIDGVKLSS